MKINKNILLIGLLVIVIIIYNSYTKKLGFIEGFWSQDDEQSSFERTNLIELD